MALVARHLPNAMLVGFAIAIVIVAWQVPEARLALVSWLLWTALCWRPSPDRHP